ncbi:MAG: helix-turn-helix transcriptional regulator [Bacteroidales bacterium]|nr:helix-turn-helix transcriptional regulator [Candidatus Sodaliphilus aphodohippi]
MTIELLEVLQLIKQHYEVDGNETMANKYSLLYFTTKDEFINKSRLGKMDEAKLNIELEQTRENVREMANRQKMQTIVLWSAIIIALLALTILAVLYVNYRKTQRTNRVLYEKNVALLRAEEDRQPKTAPEPEANHNQVSDAQPTQTDKELMEKINEVMATSPEVFESGFTLNRMTELVGSNTMYVSRAINNCRKCNFSTLLNEYRIKEACRRLLDKDKYANFTIETIANSVGYKSRTNFTKVFKDITGISPSEFQKMSKANKQEGS